MSFDFCHIFVEDNKVKFTYGSNCCPTDSSYARKVNTNYVSPGAAEVLIISLDPLDSIVFWKEDDEYKYKSTFTDMLPENLAADLAYNGIELEDDIPIEFQCVMLMLNSSAHQISTGLLLDLHHRLITGAW